MKFLNLAESELHLVLDSDCQIKNAQSVNNIGVFAITAQIYFVARVIVNGDIGL